MVPFAGWEMPVQYTSIVAEHNAVREKCGIFDVTHMGEIIVEGEESVEFLESITCNRIKDMTPGRVQYNALVNANGGLVDDITIYMIEENNYFICSNAANVNAAFEYIKNQSGKYKVKATNESNNWHQIAIQGPAASRATEMALQMDLSDIKYFHFKDFGSGDGFMRISRTGYSGEDGFEIYTPINMGVKLWEKLLNAPEDYRPIPVGLGARDSLRLEARYPLYGHELSAELTPVESGIGWIVKESEPAFPQMEKILKQKKDGTARRVCGFLLEGPGIPRDHYKVFDESGSNQIGEVLSGGHSPVLKKGMGTALLPIEYFQTGKIINIEIRNKMIAAKIVKGPFVKGTAGR